MRPWKLAVMFACLCFGQTPSSRAPDPFSVDADIHLTRAQRSALVKDEHRKSADDAAALLERALELKAEIEKNETGVVSAKSLKDADEIDRLAKNIRGRLMRN